MHPRHLSRLLHCAWLPLVIMVTAPVTAAELPPEAERRLQQGESVDLIVEFEAAGVDAETRREARRPAHDRSTMLQLRSQRLRRLKQDADLALQAQDATPILDFSHLPLQLRRFGSLTTARSWANDPRIKGIYEDKLLYPVLTNSLPLIKADVVSAAGLKGAGTTVAVIDSGVNINNAAFGCTAPGTPAGCRIVVNQLAGTATGGGSTDHGTNVSAIVLGVAPDSRVAMLNPFSGANAYSSNVIAGINWAIANADAYNIVAINMSLGDGGNYTSACASGNPFLTPVNNAMTAGITVVAASGNNAYAGGINSPACTPGVVSVGAVYSRNFGGLNWGNGLCSDTTTAADKITCFSNSASFLTLLAPGALITAAGIQQGGTSQASPHVTGAVAVLRSAYPDESLSATLNRLTANGTPVTDTRNGITKPRLNLLAAALPANDAYAAATTLGAAAGNATGSNRLATTESGEAPINAGAAGRSVWWRWTASANGQFSVDTYGSGFNTQLAVYPLAAGVAQLNRIAANDDGSTLLFQAQAGTTYIIEVDGDAGTQGDIVLNWALNPGARADLAADIAYDDATGVYTLTASNGGPQTATQVKLSATLPANASLAAVPAGCTVSGATLNCNLGTLAPDDNAAITFKLVWNGGVAGDLSATVTSDLGDDASGDNSVIAHLGTPAAIGEVPTLPEWAALLLLLMMAWRLHGERHAG